MNNKRADNVRGYSIDFVNKTITINYKFQKAAMVYGSAEYKRLKDLIADFPTFEVIVSAGKTITTTRKNKRFTYDNMKRYIGTFENADELLARFEEVREKSQKCASPYKYVTDWFNAQFPQHNMLQVDETLNKAVKLVDALDTSKYTPNSAA